MTETKTQEQEIEDALAAIRRLRAGPPVEWEILHVGAITRAGYAGASPERIRAAGDFPPDD